MPKCYQLIGVPCAGKSTWITKQDWAKDCVVVSTDEFVEAFAQSQGKTYNEVFDAYMPLAVQLMADKVVSSLDDMIKDALKGEIRKHH